MSSWVSQPSPAHPPTPKQVGPGSEQAQGAGCSGLSSLLGYSLRVVRGTLCCPVIYTQMEGRWRRGQGGLQCDLYPHLPTVQPVTPP